MLALLDVVAPLPAPLDVLAVLPALLTVLEEPQPAVTTTPDTTTTAIGTR